MSFDPTDVPTVRLNDGAEIPQFGFGVFQIPAEETGTAVRTALDAGYRHIDTAQMYGNEAEVGRAIAESGVPREETFVTTKLDNGCHAYDAALGALDESLRRFGFDHVDLFLIHWPRPQEGRYVETWTALEKLKADGKATSIGVSNFTVEHLDRLADRTGTVPAVNQIELHPQFPQVALRAYHAEHGIATEAWSPIGQGGELLQDGRLRALADEHGRSPAQVVCAGTSSSATSCSRSRSPRTGSARTLTCSTSSFRPTTCPYWTAWTPAPAGAPTPTVRLSRTCLTPPTAGPAGSAARRRGRWRRARPGPVRRTAVGTPGSGARRP
jgi:2,5-diketo-D-gluconate reductase A